ncbi:MAG: hypothetical protein KDD58_16405, partial [Bdellovibrionales bacterium]|nr:hypothetical protein [Bdellovibrionales bacterium]
MIIALSAFLITLTLVTICTWLFPLVGWMDDPHKYGYKRQPVPYGVGVVFYLSFTIVSSYFLESSPQLMAVFLAGGILS